MIKKHKLGDVFYHEPAKQWVRVIDKTTPCRACAFGADEDCLVYDYAAVTCLKYGYVKAKRPKNTIHASELTCARDDGPDRLVYDAHELARAYADAIGRHADKATIGDAAGLRPETKETIKKAQKNNSQKEIIFTQARRYGKIWQALENLFVKQPLKEHKPIEPQKCWIVCLFFGGQLLPSAMPKQHKSLHSAMTESKRLARLHDKAFVVLRAELVTQNARVPMVGCL